MLIVAGVQTPETAFGDKAPKLGAVAPEQKSAIAAKSGCVLAVIVTAKVCEVAHCPAAGVNTYDPEFTLSIVAGDQDPVIPTGEGVTKVGATVPEHIFGIVANAGLIFGAVIVTFKVCEVEHCPAAGVNTYEPEFTLSIVAGDQDPVIPKGEGVTKVGATVPEQISAIGANDGLMIGLITIVNG